jgi:hypothetical protein
MSQPPSMSQPKMKQESKRENRSNQKTYKQEIDTNVKQISLACLKDAAEMVTGDPEIC